MTPPFVKLGDVIDVLSGFAFKSEFFNDSDGLPVVRIRDVVRGYTDTYYTGPYTEQFVVRDGDILIGMDGNFNAAKWRGGRALLNQRVCKVTARASLLDEAYLFHYLPIALRRIEDATPFVTVKHLSAGDLREERIPLPPLAEQRRIAAILDKADAIRTKRREALVQLDRLAQSIFVDMFGDPSTNPESWPVTTIGAMCEVKGGKRLPKGEEYSETPTPFRYIRVTDLRGGEIDERALAYLKPDVQQKIARYTVDAGDVVISIAGSIGQVARVTESAAGANLTENAAKLCPRGQGVYEPEYLTEYLKTPYAQSQIAANTGQVTIGKLALFRIEELTVVLPPIERQRQFTHRLAAARRLRASHEQAVCKAHELFSALQQQAFTSGL